MRSRSACGKLRPNYGQTENGFITVDLGPMPRSGRTCVGRAAPGIEVRIGDDPRDPYPRPAGARVVHEPLVHGGYWIPAPRVARDD